MVDSALLTMPGGRSNNEDYILKTSYKNQECFILCDGLGGHECGEVASSYVAHRVASLFEESGDSPDFFDRAFTDAQEGLLELQRERGMEEAMKTTLIVLVVTDEYVKWAHIGDSRLYHIYDNNTKYERTRDHSLVQMLCDMGEIEEQEIRTHEDRNKVLRVMGAPWGSRKYDKSAVLERDGSMAFALMSDGCWEYVLEDEMLEILNSTKNSEEWLRGMEQLILERADMTRTDNYSIICVRM